VVPHVVLCTARGSFNSFHSFKHQSREDSPPRQSSQAQQPAAPPSARPSSTSEDLQLARRAWSCRRPHLNLRCRGVRDTRVQQRCHRNAQRQWRTAGRRLSDCRVCRSSAAVVAPCSLLMMAVTVLLTRWVALTATRGARLLTAQRARTGSRRWHATAVPAPANDYLNNIMTARSVPR
jgi:hypothetical protein